MKRSVSQQLNTWGQNQEVGVVLACLSITPSDSTCRMCVCLLTILGSQIRDFISTRGMARTALNLTLQITTWLFGILMPGAPETTKYMTSAGTVTSSYHDEPRLLLYHGGVERYIGTWDIQLYLLVSSCPFITANGQLQQPMPGKSKATLGPLRDEGLSESPCHRSKRHPSKC